MAGQDRTKCMRAWGNIRILQKYKRFIADIKAETVKKINQKGRERRGRVCALVGIIQNTHIMAVFGDSTHSTEEGKIERGETREIILATSCSTLKYEQTLDT